jgi:hypothetical protein
MSDYVREKVLRIPVEDLSHNGLLNIEYFENNFPELFKYASKDYFQTAPTERNFIDYVIDYDYGYDCGDWGKIRDLYDSEKLKYEKIFQKLNPTIDMNKVRLVEFCWYNCCEAPDYYDYAENDFYSEI